jgi:peptidoglycan hydrolase-like protein with peptidoglycan-binding domain
LVNVHGQSGLFRWVVVLAVGMVIGVAAGSVVASHAGAALPSVAPVRQTIHVAQATLERTLHYPASAEWAAVGQVYAPSGGVVTEVVTPSGVFRAGDVALRVDERPMVVIPGPVPAYRALDVGSRGRDVRALQDFLARRGFRVNPVHAVYTAMTAAAVRAWQRSLQVPTSGSVALGDLLVVAPGDLGGSPLRWIDGVHVGAPIAAGTPILSRLDEAPNVWIDFGGSLPTQIVEGLSGVAQFPGGAPVSVVIGAITQSHGATRVQLTAPGGPVCRAAGCLELVPAAGITDVQVVFTLVPSTTGPAVPSAAVQSAGDGSTFVERADGTRIAVRVIVASGGTAIVHGVTVGDEVVLP